MAHRNGSRETLMNAIVEINPKLKANPPDAKTDAAFGFPRDYLGNHFVYFAISSRARGLSVGVNLTPDKQCNFDCVYCEVDRRLPGKGKPLDLAVLSAELESTLASVRSGKLREHPLYSRVPPELLRLRHVAISGDGEPTLCPQFHDAVETVVHVRATSQMGFFKIVLITNASNLDDAQVQSGLRLLTPTDEVWAKLDAGTQAHMDGINKPEVMLDRILSNILLVAKHRPVVIQSLFPAVHDCGPSEIEIEQYAQRLKELKDAGAQISLVQIYSATRPTPHSECGHLPLRALSQIARTVRRVTGLDAQVF
jgi:wyosine [tRNA(Phe)-imidazoG37] synthetase (radical SAM superfamily)